MRRTMGRVKSGACAAGLLVILLCACGQDSPPGELDDAGVGGTGGYVSTGGSGSASSYGGSGGSGYGGAPGTGGSGVASCSLPGYDIFQGECGQCLEQNCCAEVNNCSATTGCYSCAFRMDIFIGGGCTYSNIIAADDLTICMEAECMDVCGHGWVATVDPECDVPAEAPSGGECNPGAIADCDPVTNVGCDGEAGEACHASFSNQQELYVCVPDQNTVGVCAECGHGLGGCLPTLECVFTRTGSACARMCCSDEDCGKGECHRGGGVGVCVKRGR
jgi:hypothetical protein